MMKPSKIRTWINVVAALCILAGIIKIVVDRELPNSLVADAAFWLLLGAGLLLATPLLFLRVAGIIAGWFLFANILWEVAKAAWYEITHLGSDKGPIQLDLNRNPEDD